MLSFIFFLFCFILVLVVGGLTLVVPALAILAAIKIVTWLLDRVFRG